MISKGYAMFLQTYLVNSDKVPLSSLGRQLVGYCADVQALSLLTGLQPSAGLFHWLTVVARVTGT